MIDVAAAVTEASKVNTFVLTIEVIGNTLLLRSMILHIVIDA